MQDDRRHPLDSGREHSHAVENENLKHGGEQGEAPRPSTEPRGQEHSTRTDKTRTDPATGHPQPE